MSQNEIPVQDLPEKSEEKERQAHPFSTLKELLDFVAGRTLPAATPEEAGLSEPIPFPFLAIVGQKEMKLALLLGLVNPAIGGVLLIGPRGTAKTTIVRSLLDLLPKVERSLCYYGCLPEDIESAGINAVCPDCAKKYAKGLPLAAADRVKLVELPLNSHLEDVIGGLDPRAGIAQERLRIRKGILARADRNLLYVDEINLLADDIIDAILDAGAQGTFTIHRESMSATYRARFVLIGSMNPEEGRLRPQIMDRFGLRVIVHGLDNPAERLEAYHRVHAYQVNPRNLSDFYKDEILSATREIETARQRLPKVVIPDKVAKPAINLVQKLGINSLRAEITWFEAARAYTAADGRKFVTYADLNVVAPMALRLRKSKFMEDYFQNQEMEEEELNILLTGFKQKRK